MSKDKLPSAKEVLEKHFDVDWNVEEDSIIRAMEEYKDLHCETLREEIRELKSGHAILEETYSSHTIKLKEENEELKEILKKVYKAVEYIPAHSISEEHYHTVMTAFLDVEQVINKEDKE